MAEAKELDNPFVIMTPKFQEQIKAYKKDWYNFYKKISKEKTPHFDGTGRKIIDQKDNRDYIIAAYMVECLDKHFPGWSWEMAAPIQFLGSEWILAQGTLSIIDEKLLAFGIKPPYRKFYGCNATRITYKKGASHSLENIIDVGNNVKAVNTEAMKVAINRLLHIGDDVYRKQIESEGAGDIGDILGNQDEIRSDNVSDLALKAFNQYIESKHKTYSQVFMLLGIKSLSEITDYKEAYDKLVEVWGK